MYAESIAAELTEYFNNTDNIHPARVALMNSKISNYVTDDVMSKRDNHCELGFALNRWLEIASLLDKQNRFFGADSIMIALSQTDVSRLYNENSLYGALSGDAKKLMKDLTKYLDSAGRKEISRQNKLITREKIPSSDNFYNVFETGAFQNRALRDGLKDKSNNLKQMSSKEQFSEKDKNARQEVVILNCIFDIRDQTSKTFNKQSEIESWLDDNKDDIDDKYKIIKMLYDNLSQRFDLINKIASLDKNTVGEMILTLFIRKGNPKLRISKKHQKRKKKSSINSKKLLRICGALTKNRSKNSTKLKSVDWKVRARTCLLAQKLM